MNITNVVERLNNAGTQCIMPNVISDFYLCLKALTFLHKFVKFNTLDTAKERILQESGKTTYDMWTTECVISLMR